MRKLIHEMRNQLAIATANIEAFIDGKLEPNEKRLTSVMQALTTINALINDIPADMSIAPLSAEQSISMDIEQKSMNICQLLEVTIESLRAAMNEKDISLEHHVCGDINVKCADFMGDTVRIGQIFQNLLLNAISYTPPGGKITFDCHRENGGLEIMIEDTGHGLSTHDLEHIFEPGYRGSASFDTVGTGLGLAIVQRLLETQGGSITAQCRECGAAFSVRLVDHPLECNRCEGC